MKIADLKQKATASELTLIEAVETALREEVAEKVAETMLKFIRANLPPSREDFAFDHGIGQRWLARLQEAITAPKP